MTDPFEALRPIGGPMAPDPVFAARLRDRMRDTLYPKTRGPDMTAASFDETPSATTTPGVVPYLIVSDARAALDWYTDVFGAHQRGAAMIMDDGRVGHAELELAGAIVYVADDPSPSPTEVAAPVAGVPAAVSLVMEADDVDRVVDGAVAAGARLERAAADHPYGRNAVLRDPFGHRWMVSGPVLAPAPGGAAPGTVEPASGEVIRQGDVGYVSLWVRDLVASAQFFADVLGWEYRDAGGGSRLRRDVVPSQGLIALDRAGEYLGGVRDHPTAFLVFAVDDVDEAVARVRAAGGRAAEPVAEPYGRTADCVDDQGTDFALFTAAPGSDRRPPINGERHGDVAYVTIGTVDWARARAFYGAVLGWTFSAGTVAQGGQIDGTAPMMGMHGGQDRATVVPSYRVDDLAAAVARVRTLGGAATDPEHQPYGDTSQCTDPGGTRFYLHQM